MHAEAAERATYLGTPQNPPPSWPEVFVADAFLCPSTLPKCSPGRCWTLIYAIYFHGADVPTWMEQGFL